MALGLNTSVKELYGVGAARAKAYARLGIHDLRGLITHYPRRYENRGDVRALASCDNGERCSFIHPHNPSKFVMNECFPRGVKAYAQPFRNTKQQKIWDTPTDLLYGKTKMRKENESV